MKNYTDIPYERLAILYLVQDTIADKKELLWIGLAVSGWVITIVNIIIIYFNL